MATYGYVGVSTVRQADEGESFANPCQGRVPIRRFRNLGLQAIPVAHDLGYKQAGF
jgi:hypothetical protein